MRRNVASTGGFLWRHISICLPRPLFWKMDPFCRAIFWVITFSSPLMHWIFKWNRPAVLNVNKSLPKVLRIFLSCWVGLMIWKKYARRKKHTHCPHYDWRLADTIKMILFSFCNIPYISIQLDDIHVYQDWTVPAFRKFYCYKAKKERVG